MSRRRTPWWIVAGVTASLAVVVALVLIPRLVPVVAGLYGFPSCPPPADGLKPEGAPFDPLVRPATIGFFPEPMSHRHTRTGPDLYEVGYTWRDHDSEDESIFGSDDDYDGLEFGLGTSVSF